jgi:uncharacterized protein
MDSYCATLIRLDNWLLPGGRQEIHVIEPDLLRLVAEHLKNQADIVVGVIADEDQSLPCYRIATECKIVDFFQLDDGSLSIVIEGIQRVRILDIQNILGSYQVTVRPLPNWPSEPMSEDFEVLAQALLDFYNTNPSISELYSHIHLEDLNWVSQRWLEVLPMYHQDKQRLIKEENCQKAVTFVKHLIQGVEGP